MNTLEFDVIKKVVMKKSIKVAVTGNSMYPNLREKDIINISSSQCYKIGDICLFYYKNTFIVHRLLNIINEHYYFKGDNSFTIEIIEKDKIVGKVTSLHRMGKNIDALCKSSSIVSDSLRIHKLFCENDFSIENTIRTKEYKKYVRNHLM